MHIFALSGTTCTRKYSTSQAVKLVAASVERFYTYAGRSLGRQGAAVLLYGVYTYQFRCQLSSAKAKLRTCCLNCFSLNRFGGCNRLCVSAHKELQASSQKCGWVVAQLLLYHCGTVTLVPLRHSYSCTTVAQLLLYHCGKQCGKGGTSALNVHCAKSSFI